MRLLKLVLKIGKVFGMSPDLTGNGEKRFPRKSQAYFTITFYTISIIFSGYYRLPDYLQLMHMSLLIRILLDTILYTLNIYTVLTTLKKKPEWNLLINNLKNRKVENKDFPLVFIITNLIFWGLHIYYLCVMHAIMGIELYKQYFLEILQLYAQFIVYLLLYSISKIILRRYEALTKFLLSAVDKLERKSFGPSHFLSTVYKIKDEFLLLKETVDTFNNIFGFPFLLVIFFTSLQILVYVDHIFAIINYSVAKMVISDVAIIILISVGTYGNVFLCDAVVHEAHRIFSIICTMQKYYPYKYRKARGELQTLISAIRENLPVFEAWRFFGISRATIFDIIYAIVTFLIVLIQFESSDPRNQA